MRFLLLLGFSALVFGQISPLTVRARGEAALSVHPDQAVVRVTVSTTGNSSEQAAAKNSRQTADVLDHLRAALGAATDIKTERYAVSGGPDHYFATNRLAVNVGDPSRAGIAIDAATKSGAIVLAGFEAADAVEQEARKEALQQASINARANAESIASSLGLRVVRVIGAESAGAMTTPSFARAALETHAKKRIPTTLTPADVVVRAEVIVTVEVAQ